MADAPPPRLYLVTPDRAEPEALARALGPLLATGGIACVRLDCGRAAEDDWVRAANHLLAVCHGADVPLVVADHHRLVEPLGLDGVHLSDARVPLRTVRKALGPDRIVGAHGGTGRHGAMTLAEAGADYVCLGPLSASGTLGDGSVADDALFDWWAEMIETPVVAEGALGPDDVARLAGSVDFFVPGPEIWSAETGVEALGRYIRALG